MTVRELIAELQKLNQDKGIWLVYDSFRASVPLPDKYASTSEAEYLSDEDTDVRRGDYLIIAG